MKCTRVCMLLIGIFYVLLFSALVISHHVYPRDQLIILGIIGMPFSFLMWLLFLLPDEAVQFIFGETNFGVHTQTALLGILGLLQYLLAGYLFGKSLCKRWHKP